MHHHDSPQAQKPPLITVAMEYVLQELLQPSIALCALQEPTPACLVCDDILMSRSIGHHGPGLGDSKADKCNVEP